MSFFRSTINAIVVLSISCCSLTAQENVDFAHEIFPVIKKRCASCHGNGSYKGGLSLESRESLLESGTVTVKDHAASDLIDRLESEEDDFKMPPEGARLSDSEIKAFKDWIDQGLEWPAELTLRTKRFKRPLELTPVALPPATKELHHPIDRLLADYFAKHNLEHPEPLSPVAFLRRAKMDLLGVLPTSDEIERAQNAETSGDGHVATIKSLLVNDRQYADHWLTFWNDLLRNDYVGTGYIDGGRTQITEWLHRSLMENKPYDQFVAELIDPVEGSGGFIKGIQWRGRVNASQVRELQFSQNISQVFLGINMKCASCHDSFVDDWKLKDAYGLAAIIADQPLEIHRCDVATGEKATSKFVFPEIGEVDQTAPRDERLKQLSNLMTAKQNGRFARTIVNRLWHRMIGRGLVHPVDVMANKAWSETLLDFLAANLIENQYDLKQTLELIATSKVYRSKSVSISTEANAQKDFVFQGVLPKRISAEQFIDSIWDLTGTAPENVDAAVHLEGKPMSAKWIWSNQDFHSAPGGQVVMFKYEFDVPAKPKIARAIASCDNSFRIWLNGKLVGNSDTWEQPKMLDLKRRVKVGKNVLVVRAANGGTTPNPAAFVLQASVDLADSTAIKFHSDSSWMCTESIFDPTKFDPARNLPADIEWKKAIELVGANQVYAAAKQSFETKVARLESGQMVLARASLVKSNDLMRSLGRPNREQVVTTRPADLSTLQALDLSNGESLTKMLRKGAKVWREKKQDAKWTDNELVNEFFKSALSRDATEKEIALLTPFDTPELESIEDLIWTVLLLPEFQFVK